MSRRVSAVIAVVLACALWPAHGYAAARLSVAASPAVVEPGDALTFTLRRGTGSCRLTAALDRRGAHTALRGRPRGTLTVTTKPTLKPGRYLAHVRCGRKRATTSFLVHNPKGPDFALPLAPVGRGGKRATPRISRVRATNLAPWAAPPARLCVNVAGAGVTITAVKNSAS